MGDLEVLKLTFHLSEFRLDDAQTLFDETGGVDCHLVLVFDSLLVVFIEENVEHILRPLPVVVLKGEREYRCIVVRLADHEA